LPVCRAGLLPTRLPTGGLATRCLHCVRVGRGLLAGGQPALWRVISTAAMGAAGPAQAASNPQGLNTWAYDEGQDFKADHASPNIDFLSTHLWVDNWQDKTVEFAQRWIRAHIQVIASSSVRSTCVFPALLGSLRQRAMLCMIVGLAAFYQWTENLCSALWIPGCRGAGQADGNGGGEPLQLAADTGGARRPNVHAAQTRPADSPTLDPPTSRPHAAPAPFSLAHGMTGIVTSTTRSSTMRSQM
jgi:hypothetical protein